MPAVNCNATSRAGWSALRALVRKAAPPPAPWLGLPVHSPAQHAPRNPDAGSGTKPGARSCRPRGQSPRPSVPRVGDYLPGAGCRSRAPTCAGVAGGAASRRAGRLSQRRAQAGARETAGPTGPVTAGRLAARSGVNSSQRAATSGKWPCWRRLLQRSGVDWPPAAGPSPLPGFAPELCAAYRRVKRRQNASASTKLGRKNESKAASAPGSTRLVLAIKKSVGQLVGALLNLGKGKANLSKSFFFNCCSVGQ